MLHSMDEKRSILYMRDVPMSGADWLVDVVIALGAFGFGLLQMSASANLMIPDDFIRQLLGIRAISLSGWGILMVALTCTPLIVRRRLPWPVFMLSGALWVFFETQMGAATLSLIGPLIALFTVAYERTRGEAAIAACSLIAAVGLSALSANTSSLAMLMMVQNFAIVVAVALAGVALHASRESVEAVEARAQQAERTREAHAEKRVEEERLRIAREVHDITAHSLSAVSIQSAAAAALMETDPVAAKEALESIRKTSKDALAEMRGMISVLRDGSAEDDMQPMMGVDDLGALLDYLRSAGIEATLRSDGRRESLPAYIGMAIYGIAREAVTNIVRHSDAKSASIELAIGDDMVTLDVSDDGRGIEGDADMGHGIEGMRERVNVLGGMFSIGPGKNGGTRMRASIPFVPVGTD